MEDRDPMEGDKLRAIFNGVNEDDIEEPSNPELEYVVEFFDCAGLIPLANRIIWLSSIKEAKGIIPDEIPIDYEELQLLVILQEERDKKIAYDNFKLREENKQQRRIQEEQQLKSGSVSGTNSRINKTSSVGLAGAITLNK